MNDNLAVDFEITDAKVLETDALSYLKFLCPLNRGIGLGDKGWVSGIGFLEALYVEVEHCSHEYGIEASSEFACKVLAKGTKKDPSDNPRVVSAMDQAGASLRTIAPAVSQLFDALRKQGRSRSEAALIAGAWVVLSSQDGAEEHQRQRRENKNG